MMNMIYNGFYWMDCPASTLDSDHMFFTVDVRLMKNLHLEHPEDTILTGDLSVLDWFKAEGQMSVKIDGALLLFGAKILRLEHSL